MTYVASYNLYEDELGVGRGAETCGCVIAPLFCGATLVCTYADGGAL